MFTFLCAVVLVHDADTFRCADGTKVRAAAINARETDGSCKRGAPCPAMRHQQALPIAKRMILGRSLRCRKVGVSWDRVVADCRLPDGRTYSCAILATGAVAWWSDYQVDYRMKGCRR